MYTPQQVVRLLNGRWLLMLGDSNTRRTFDEACTSLSATFAHVLKGGRSKLSPWRRSNGELGMCTNSHTDFAIVLVGSWLDHPRMNELRLTGVPLVEVAAALGFPP